MPRIVILIACMHQRDKSIVSRSNVQTDCVVVNQTDCDAVEEFDFTNKFGQTCRCKFISTTERGLSRSRNMAIASAPEDSICVICDDDELLEDDIEAKISDAYASMPGLAVAAFSLIRKDCSRTYPAESYRIGFRKALKISSLQITFKKRAVDDAHIRFDEKMGSGTGNGGGEENKFILDCLKARLKAHYFPMVIATVLPGESQWYQGHDARFLYNNGWSARHMLGFVLGFLYICYSTFHLRSRYEAKGLTPRIAFKSLFKGFLSKR